MINLHFLLQTLYRHAPAVLATILLVAMLATCEPDDPLATQNHLSGKVTDRTSTAGPIVVQIFYYLRDIADAQGRFEIVVHNDFLVDSLHAWVDVNDNRKHDPAEPYGFYGSRNPDRAQAFRVRNSDVGQLDFDIDIAGMVSADARPR